MERNSGEKKERLVFKGNAEGDMIKGIVNLEGAADEKSIKWSAKRIKN